jgi:retron-type reverse transcriptase
MKNIFPENWLLNINNTKQLSDRICLPVDYLQKIEKKIPYCYRKKTIIKKNKPRDLLIPNQELKDIQRKILANILNFKFPSYVQGGVSGRSVITNAKLHLSQKWVMCLDVRKFFPSVHFKRIYNNFILLKCHPTVANLLTHFVTYNYELPQGTPTSPAIANLVLYNLDKRLFNLCRLNGFNYSRYFDDITISGKNNPETILNKCGLIVSQEGFKINKKPEKLRIMSSSEKQIVTGFMVNGKNLHLPPEKITEIKDIINKLNSKNISIFADKEPIKVREIIHGHLAFLESFDSKIAKELKTDFNKINWDYFCS